MNDLNKPDISFDDIRKANATITTTNIKGKEYAEVNQRIKAFRMVFPQGSITTELINNNNGVCVFRAVAADKDGNILGTGTAYEKESSTYINKTSFIENCETSAVGRALGMCGFGIDTSIASADEVLNAQNNQKKTLDGTKPPSKFHSPKQLADKKDIERLVWLAQEAGVDLSKLEKKYKVKAITALTSEQAAQCITGLEGMLNNG